MLIQFALLFNYYCFCALYSSLSIITSYKEDNVFKQIIVHLNQMDQSKFSAMPMKSLEPESDEEEQELEDLLQNLKDHLKDCQKLGKYVEAHMTQKRIAELKEKQSELRITKFQKAQEKEKRLFQEAHQKERAQVEEKWMRKLQEHDQKAGAEVDALQQKHQEELEEARGEAETKIPEKAHVSQEIVAMKKMELALANQGKFEEAHTIKMEILRKEKEEQAQWLDEREEKIGKRLQVVVSRQNNEMQALYLVHYKARALIEKNMNTELETLFLREITIKCRLEKKYRNSKSALENDNQIVLKKLELQNSKFEQGDAKQRQRESQLKGRQERTASNQQSQSSNKVTVVTTVQDFWVKVCFKLIFALLFTLCCT
eukprot:TRINITY_DN88195_c3_g1_i1.p4 TRINITY_DN88195_c3_g1~~TRINITY_DN88195_c3_g1_i1.p4  ORF type:complete len:372 (-),score=60.33 TRINITY_DN88195_c3_g1_i1:1727-2842(-)